MRIWLNEKPLTLAPGMKVREALIQAGLFQEIEQGGKVYDDWGNEVGLDGSLQEGNRYTLEKADSQ
jgi:hypothetical protein